MLNSSGVLSFVACKLHPFPLCYRCVTDGVTWACGAADRLLGSDQRFLIWAPWISGKGPQISTKIKCKKIHSVTCINFDPRAKVPITDTSWLPNALRSLPHLIASLSLLADLFWGGSQPWVSPAAICCAYLLRRFLGPVPRVLTFFTSFPNDSGGLLLMYGVTLLSTARSPSGSAEAIITFQVLEDMAFWIVLLLLDWVVPPCASCSSRTFQALCAWTLLNGSLPLLNHNQHVSKHRHHLPHALGVEHKHFFS